MRKIGSVVPASGDTSASSAVARLARARSWPERLTSRAAPGIIVALALLVASPSLAIGFYTDDYTFLAALRHHVRPFYDLFRFSPGDISSNQALIATGDYPWWTAPDFKLHLIRPFTSAVFALDDALFGNAPPGYHLDALIWFAALLAGAWLLFKRLLPTGAATLALLVFAFRSGHVLPYAWLSARHVLIAGVPATFALLAHLKAVRDGWRPGWLLGPLLLVVALCGSEIALGIVPFWVAHDAWLAWKSRRARRPWKSAMASVPAVAVALLYLVCYRLLGGGARSSPSYHNPLNDPGAFLRVVPTRIPVLLADALLGVPVVFSIDGPATAILVAGVAGVLLCAVLLAACRPLHVREREALSWLLPAAAMALPLGVSGPPWGHVLLLPDLAFSALIGVLLTHALAAARSARIERRQVVLIVGSAILIGGHLIAAPAMSLLTIHRLAQGARITEDTAATADVGTIPGARVFLMDATDSMVFFYPRDVLAVKAAGKVACWSVLSGLDARHEVERTGTSSFTLRKVGHSRGDAFKSLFFGARHFAVGDAVLQCGATIRVDALDGGDPSELGVTLDEPLESRDLAFLELRDGHLQRLELPEPGQRADVLDDADVALTSAVVRARPPSGH